MGCKVSRLDSEEGQANLSSIRVLSKRRSAGRDVEDPVNGDAVHPLAATEEDREMVKNGEDNEEEVKVGEGKMEIMKKKQRASEDKMVMVVEETEEEDGRRLVLRRNRHAKNENGEVEENPGSPSFRVYFVDDSMKSSASSRNSSQEDLIGGICKKQTSTGKDYTEGPHYETFIPIANNLLLITFTTTLTLFITGIRIQLRSASGED